MMHAVLKRSLLSSPSKALFLWIYPTPAASQVQSPPSRKRGAPPLLNQSRAKRGQRKLLRDRIYSHARRHFHLFKHLVQRIRHLDDAHVGRQRGRALGTGHGRMWTSLRGAIERRSQYGTANKTLESTDKAHTGGSPDSGLAMGRQPADRYSATKNHAAYLARNVFADAVGQVSEELRGLVDAELVAQVEGGALPIFEGHRRITIAKMFHLQKTQQVVVPVQQVCVKTSNDAIPKSSGGGRSSDSSSSSSSSSSSKQISITASRQYEQQVSTYETCHTNMMHVRLKPS